MGLYLPTHRVYTKIESLNIKKKKQVSCKATILIDCNKTIIIIIDVPYFGPSLHDLLRGEGGDLHGHRGPDLPSEMVVDVEPELVEAHSILEVVRTPWIEDLCVAAIKRRTGWPALSRSEA